MAATRLSHLMSLPPEDKALEGAAEQAAAFNNADVSSMCG